MITQSSSQREIDHDPELAPVICTNCATELDEEPWPQTCPKCQQPLDLQAQFAYCRGQDAFTVGQELIMKAFRGRKERKLALQTEKDGIQYYMQAYTSLQQAFQGELAESQRQLGIKMMASMVQVFQRNAMVSPLEAAYWSMLLVELNSRLEWISLQEKLALKTDHGVLGLPLRWRWRSRMNQLKKALVTLNQKVRFLERNIGFAEQMHLRQKNR